MPPRKTAPVEPFDLRDQVLKTACDTFMRLVADHGIFHIDQLLLYVGERAGRVLSTAERGDVVKYMQARGARRGWDKKPYLFRFPTRRRGEFPKGKKDKQTLDLFAPRADA